MLFVVVVVVVVFFVFRFKFISLLGKETKELRGRERERGREGFRDSFYFSQSQFSNQDDCYCD